MKLWIARDEFGTLSLHKTKPLYDMVYDLLMSELEKAKQEFKEL